VSLACPTLDIAAFRLPIRCGSSVGGGAQLSLAESCPKCGDVAGLGEVNPQAHMIGAEVVAHQARVDATLLEPVPDLRQADREVPIVQPQVDWIHAAIRGCLRAAQGSLVGRDPSTFAQNCHTSALTWIIASAAALPHAVNSVTLRGKMIGSPRQLYVVDVYHQPSGYAHPVVKEQHRLVARSDDEGIREAQAIFVGRDAPLVTGFALRSVGSRRFGEQVIYRHEKAADAPAIKYAATDPNPASRIEPDSAVAMLPQSLRT
jgi:hypothetical protein